VVGVTGRSGSLRCKRIGDSCYRQQTVRYRHAVRQ